MRMDVVSLTRQFVDIESISGNEGAVGHFLAQELRSLAYDARRMVVEGGRATNVTPDHARAQPLYRLIGPADQLRREIAATVGDFAEAELSLWIPFVLLRAFE